MTDKSIEKTIEAAIEQEEDRKQSERHSIPWENDRERLLVVNLPLDLLKLNPNSHRIKAQLTAHANRQLVQDNPLCDEAQQIIATQLRETKGFEGLRDDLDEKGQSDPGVVTREGVLINANRRAVALRDLNVTHIKVMVLPPNATITQISELELRLQVSKDYKQEYTFTNRLLFIEDCVAAGWDEVRIAREVYGTEKKRPKPLDKVKKDLRMLSIVQELIEMSDGQYNYPYFDDKAVALEELDRDYEEKKKSDPAAALRLREARQVAILAGVGYSDIRHINAEFVQEHLEEELEEAEDLEGLKESLEEEEEDTPPGLGLLGGGTPGAAARRSTQLLGWLTRTAGEDEVSFSAPSGDPVRRARVDVVDGLRTAVENAVSNVKAFKQRGNRLKRPARAVQDAVAKLTAAATYFDKARTDVAFAPEVSKLRDKMGAARRALDSLTALVDQHFPEGGGE